MKKTILLSLIALNLSVNAQMNDHFYLCTGSWISPPNYSIQLAKDLGAKGAGNSFKIVWRSVQDSLTSPYIWTSIDQTVQALQNDTLDMYAYVLCVGPKKISPNSCNTSYNPLGPNGGQSWFPEDTVKWKQFIYAMIERYDKDGTADMPGLKFPVNKWRIETEWQSFWCSSNADTSLAVAQEFTKHVNMTANVIKTKQPTFTVSFAGMDPIHDRTVFYDGYTAPEPTYCFSQNCVTQLNWTKSQIVLLDPTFLPKRRNMIYILRNCNVDEIDIHQYGRWKYIPNTIQWYKDSAYTGTKKINFLEGAGPFCKLCDSIYHPGTDTTGILPPQLVRNNASYLVYWHIMGLANKVKILSWYRLTPDYKNSGAAFGDFCLESKSYVKKPAYYVYRFLAKNIFSNQNADSVVKITESNPNLYHYQVQPMGMNVAWSTNPTDSIVISGTGNLFTWDIPITCNTTFPTVCDSIFPMNNYSVSGSHTILLNNGVPVFYSWNNVLGITQTNEQKNISVNIYPNPSGNLINIDINDSRITNYDIKTYDMLGNIIFSKTFNSKHETLNLNLPNGMYFYQVKDTEKIIGTGKVIIQN